MTETNIQCPVCGDGHLVAQIIQTPVEYNGKSGDLSIRLSVCTACGSEQAGASEMRANKRAMVAFRKQVDRLLTGAEVRAVREKLQLTQARAAEIFGGGLVAFSKYENDDIAQSEAMDKLLRVAAVLPSAFNYLASRAGPGSVLKGAGWQPSARAQTKNRRVPTLRLVRAFELSTDRKWSRAA